MELPPLFPHRSEEPHEETYEYDWSWPPGVATLRRVFPRDGYPLDYVPQAAKLAAELTRNRGRMALEGAREIPPPHIPASPDDLRSGLYRVVDDLAAGAPKVRPKTPAEYVKYFATIPIAVHAERQTRDPGIADRAFAWQRIAGANPMSIRRVARLPEDFPVTEAVWTRAVGEGSLAEALGNGKAYVVDHSLLHGAPTTRYLGRQKYLTGARALFGALPTGKGELTPVAIQLEPGGGVVTPKDGVTWAMARYCFQVADANVHETMEHLGATHMVMEALGIAGRRTLAGDHPLRKLLDPHIAGTFAVNDSAKHFLIAPDGVVDRVFAARIDVAVSLVRTALDRFSLQDRAPSHEIAARGMDDPEVVFPYRDDVALVYAAIERFVSGYVRQTYASDAAVAADAQLRAWVAEAGSPIAGNLKNVRPVETLADLTLWMTNLIHIGSAQHAAVNFPQFPYFGWGANVAGACWGPPPKLDGSATEGDLAALMPPWDCLTRQADTVFLLSGIYYRPLGTYAHLGDDPRTKPLIDAFAKDLAAVDAAILAREGDGSRFLPYPFLRPSLIPSSINI
jgi:arachidonate 15-lipoxygenase